MDRAATLATLPALPALPPAHAVMSRRLRLQVQQFFDQAEPEASVLVVDSCGPVVTQQLQILDAVGHERLLRLRAVHAFSGGAFALFIYLGLLSGAGRIRPAELATRENEQRFRTFHHPGSAPVARAIFHLLTGRPAFASSQPVHDSLRFILEQRFVDAPFRQMPANLHLNVKDKQTGRSVEISHATLSRPELAPLAAMTMGEIISMCVGIPGVYGDADGLRRYGDPIYASDHRSYIKAICDSGAPTLVSTPWREGSKGSMRFVKCTAARHPRVAVAADMARMLLNLRNRDWQNYACAAFEHPVPAGDPFQ
jgi:hypothetical protein